MANRLSPISSSGGNGKNSRILSSMQLQQNLLLQSGQNGLPLNPDLPENYLGQQLRQAFSPVLVELSPLIELDPKKATSQTKTPHMRNDFHHHHFDNSTEKRESQIIDQIMRESFPTMTGISREPNVVLSGQKTMPIGPDSSGQIDLITYTKKENLEPKKKLVGPRRSDSLRLQNFNNKRTSTAGRLNTPSVASMQMFKANQKKSDLNILESS